MNYWTSILATVALTAPAFASGPMSGNEFESYVTGKTLTYSSGGMNYGIEEYLENRRVRWSYLDGRCQEGEWYEAGEMICFVYDEIEGAQCWTFYLESSGLRALFMNDPTQTELYETTASDGEMLCLGPEIGV